MQLCELEWYEYPPKWYQFTLRQLAGMLAQVTLDYKQARWHWQGELTYQEILGHFDLSEDLDQDDLISFFQVYIDDHLTQLYKDEYFGPKRKLDNPDKAHMLAAVCYAFYCNSRCDVIKALCKFAVDE